MVYMDNCLPKTTLVYNQEY